MAELPDFTRLVPGFEFLQGLVKNAGSAMPAIPGMSQWIAPTLDPEEIEKRVGELKTVQFWLEQNARLLGTTIQAMEVQRMTLSTLKTMNVKMDDLRESMTAKVPPSSAFGAGATAFPTQLTDAFASAFKFASGASGVDGAGSDVGKGSEAGKFGEAGHAAAGTAAPAPNPFIRPKPATRDAEAADDRPASGASAPAASADTGAEAGAASPAAPAVDPMKWWGALTEQFATLAATAIKDGTTEAQRTMAGITAAATKAVRPPRPARTTGRKADPDAAPAVTASTRSRGSAGGTAKGAAKDATGSMAKSARSASTGSARSTGPAAKSTRTSASPSRRSTSR